LLGLSVRDSDGSIWDRGSSQSAESASLSHVIQSALGSCPSAFLAPCLPCHLSQSSYGSQVGDLSLSLPLSTAQVIQPGPGSIQPGLTWGCSKSRETPPPIAAKTAQVAYSRRSSQQAGSQKCIAAEMAHNNIQYSEKYYDDTFEYRRDRGRAREWGLYACVERVHRARGPPSMTRILPCNALHACRHVVLPPEIASLLPKGRLLSEVLRMGARCREGHAPWAHVEGMQCRGSCLSSRMPRPNHTCTLPTHKTQAEWRSIGVQQSRGWVHYAIHRPEPHIMLFR
jgi:hypothetical protein